MNILKISFITLSLFIAQNLVAQFTPEEPENFHIFLLMGQSNMEGGQATDGPMDTEVHPRVFKLNSWNSWTPAKDPISNNITQGVGPGLAFAKKYAELNPDVTVGLVPLAKGATHLSEWMKGSELYNGTLNQAAVARQNGVIKGILWHQGEHDAIFHYEAVTYLERFRVFADDIRKDLGILDLPIVVAGFSRDIDQTKHSQWFLVWESLKELARSVYNVGYVATSEIPNRTGLDDPLHFSVQGQRMLGEAYCDEYLRMTGFWTEQAKEAMDAVAEELEEGWKYHPQYGLYYDENFPIIKHAQLGWIKVEALADTSIRLKSKLFGSFRTIPEDESENGFYIYRENVDPELIHEPGDTFYVNLLADETTEDVYFNHTTLEWQSKLAEEPDFLVTSDFYSTAESMFTLTQESSQATINASFLDSWTDVFKQLKETEENRLFTILYAEEAYQFADEQEPKKNLRTFYMEKSVDLLERVDAALIDAQTAFENFLNIHLE